MTNEPTYQLSIVIVNYNVEYFLDQCLDSVKKAILPISAEVIIVDNCSVDGSIEMLKSKYPEFELIENKINSGFSKANNQAIRQAKGKYVLLLNPDTIVAEDTFSKVVAFMDNTPDCGGLGVHMIDGKGCFLPESKRGLPTPMVAFYKIFGLSKIFPKSKRFGQYHLGHLGEFEINKIDVLSGAFMLLRAEALEKVGLLDEDFFMYGEDIDLSYRITLGGYNNYYFPDTSIIHYKGESTKKSSINYVFVFYRAMVIFAKKHFSGKNARLYSLLINFAIYIRASLALLVRFVKQAFLPVIDFIYIVTGLYALTNYWRLAEIEFQEDLIKYSIPIYAATWLITSIFNGGYDVPIRLFKLLKGVFWGTIFILIAYATLPKSLQFSRLFIFIGAAWVFGYYVISRIFLHFAIRKKFNLKVRSKKNFVVIGSHQEFQRVVDLLKQTNDRIGKISSISIEELAPEIECDELVFCSKDMSYMEIIHIMRTLELDHFDFKIAPANAMHVIGSNSIETAGDLYILNLNTLVSKENKRKKRLFDVLGSGLLLVTIPVSAFMFKHKKKYIQNLAAIFIGRKSFIGFSDEDMQRDVRLPKIKAGVLSPCDGVTIDLPSIHEKINLLYARDYSMRKDFSIILNSWTKLDQ